MCNIISIPRVMCLLLFLKKANTGFYICNHKPRSVYDKSFAHNIHPLNDKSLAPMILLFYISFLHWFLPHTLFNLIYWVEGLAFYFIFLLLNKLNHLSKNQLVDNKRFLSLLNAWCSREMRQPPLMIFTSPLHLWNWKIQSSSFVCLGELTSFFFFFKYLE